MSEKKTCCGLVYDGWSHHACGRTAKFHHNGKWYCGTHDPVKVKERQEARDAVYNAKRDRERTLRRLNTDMASAERAVIEAVIPWRYSAESPPEEALVMAVDRLEVAREALRKFKPTAEDPLATTHKAGEQ